MRPGVYFNLVTVPNPLYRYRNVIHQNRKEFYDMKVERMLKRKESVESGVAGRPFALCSSQSASSLTSQDGGGVSEAGRGPVPPLPLDVHLQELPRRVLSLHPKDSFI